MMTMMMSGVGFGLVRNLWMRGHCGWLEISVLGKFCVQTSI